MANLTQEQIATLKALLKAKKINLDLDNPNELNQTLQSLGIDSLSALSLIMAIEDKFKIRLNDEKIARIQNIGQLIDLLAETINQK